MAQELFGLGKKKERDDYTRKGKLNKTAFPDQFVKICRYGQRELKNYLIKKLDKYYEDVIVGDGFILAKGDMKVCLTAHMDTVHTEKCREIYGYKDKKNNRNIISSPQGIGGDDRCGIYMIMNIIQTTNYRPYILFCEDEEIGGIGSNKFLRTDYADELRDMLFFIELDRANGNDLVFYEDINYDFHDWCEQVTNYVTAYGSFSDISNLCPELGSSGVNISCGYYNAHHTTEYVVLEEMMAGIKAAKKLLKASKDLDGKFEYIEQRYTSRFGNVYEWYGYDYGYRDPYTRYDEPKDKGKVTGNDELDKALWGLVDENKTYADVMTEPKYFDGDGVGIKFIFDNGQSMEYFGLSDYECFGQFLYDHPHISFNEIEEIEYTY